MRKYSKRARKITRSRRFRKTRKQRGGSGPFLFFFKNDNENTLQTLDLETDTLRTLFEKFIKVMKLPANESIENYVLNNYISERKTPIVPSNFEDGWDTSMKEIIGVYSLQKESKFEFKRVKGIVANQKASDLKIIEKVLEQYKSTGAKIILQSSAASGKRMDVNVYQQFQFNHKPISPIILIDINFFRPNMQHDFYKYLQFEGPVTFSTIKETTTFFNSEEKVPKVQVFKKPAQKEVEILGTPVSIIENNKESMIKEEDQEAYKKEFLLQAKAFNIDTTATELEICCIQAELDQHDVYNLPKNKSNFYRLIGKYGKAFSVFDYKTGFVEMEIALGRKVEERSTMDNLD